jgi:DHA1 family inner membrane transport protein
VWLTLGIGAIGFGGFFAAYSYIASIVTEVAGARMGRADRPRRDGNRDDDRQSPRRTARRPRPPTYAAVGFGGLALVQVLLALTCGWIVTLVVVFFVGVVSSALSPSIQTRLMDVAGDNQSIAAALNHSALNIGNATGPPSAVP